MTSAPTGLGSSQRSNIRVGIDGTLLAQQLTGRGRYIFELCRDLDAAMPGARFFVYAPYPVPMPVGSERWALRADRTWTYIRASSTIWLMTRAAALCRSDGVEAFWAGGTLLPPLGRKIRKVVTVHDLNHLIVPATMKFTSLLSHRMLFHSSLRRADAIISNSQGTADRLFELLGFTSVAIIRPGVSENFGPVSEAEMRTCLETVGIQRPYLLAVATAEPRKNLELLIKTFLNMKRAGILARHRLVLAGASGWKDRSLLATARAASQAGALISLGYVPDYRLPALYCGADAFVFPSLYEGFGIPVLEARACGTPVVATDIPELREAGGKDAIYVPPTEEGIRTGIAVVLKRPRPTIPDPSSARWRGRARALAAALQNRLDRGVYLDE